jgi:hypothetical protein
MPSSQIITFKPQLKDHWRTFRTLLCPLEKFTVQLCFPLSLAYRQTIRPQLHAASIVLSMRKTRLSYPLLPSRSCRRISATSSSGYGTKCEPPTSQGPLWCSCVDCKHSQKSRQLYSLKSQSNGSKLLLIWEWPDSQLPCSSHMKQVVKKTGQRLGTLGALPNRRSGLSIAVGVLRWNMLSCFDVCC